VSAFALERDRLARECAIIGDKLQDLAAEIASARVADDGTDAARVERVQRSESFDALVFARDRAWAAARTLTAMGRVVQIPDTRPLLPEVRP